jgi:uncharacterized protein (DUF2267 family)
MPRTNFSHALHNAHVWIADVALALQLEDRRVAHRVLRGWLHALRDRLTVEAAVKFGQQLPEILRGEYYDGWEPNKAPMKYDAAGYVRRFAAEALVAPQEVPAIAASITEVITEHMSPCQVDTALAELPAELRATVRDGAAPARPVTDGDAGAGGALDERVTALAEAVRTLARGLKDDGIGDTVDQARVARAARLAEEILVATQR